MGSELAGSALLQPRHVDSSPCRVGRLLFEPLCVDAWNLDSQQDVMIRWNLTIAVCLHSAGVGVVSGLDERIEAHSPLVIRQGMT